MLGVAESTRLITCLTAEASLHWVSQTPEHASPARKDSKFGSLLSPVLKYNRWVLGIVEISPCLTEPGSLWSLGDWSPPAGGGEPNGAGQNAGETTASVATTPESTTSPPPAAKTKKQLGRERRAQALEQEITSGARVLYINEQGQPWSGLRVLGAQHQGDLRAQVKDAKAASSEVLLAFAGHMGFIKQRTCQLSAASCVAWFHLRTVAQPTYCPIWFYGQCTCMPESQFISGNVDMKDKAELAFGTKFPINFRVPCSEHGSGRA